MRPDPQLPVWWMLPESPRWLLSHGRELQAREVMEKCARMNGKEMDLSRHVIKKHELNQEEKQEPLGFSSLFSKEVWVMTVSMIFLWPIVTMAYFGLGLSMTQLGGNIFVSFILGALTEVATSYSVIIMTSFRSLGIHYAFS